MLPIAARIALVLLVAARGASASSAKPAPCVADLECTLDTLCVDNVCVKRANATLGIPEHSGCHGDETYSGKLAHDFTREEFLSFFITCIVSLMILITAWELLVSTRELGKVVPVAAFSLVLGMVFGYAMRVLDLEGPEAHVAAFSNSLFLFVLLPPIIYESAFMMDRKTFFHNIGTIVIIVIPGVLMSTAMIGLCMYWAGRAGAFTHNGVDPLDFSSPIQPFIFGALISATDPVATLAILSTVQISPVLFALIFGESMLNDAVSIVVYEVLKWYGDDAFTFHATPIVARDFFGIAIGSVAVGLAIGLASSALHRRMMTQSLHNAAGEMALLMLFGYLSYALAEVCSLSGITALLVCGIVQRYYAFYSISHEAQHASHHVLKLIASKSEQFVFLYLGINVFLMSGGPTGGPTSDLPHRLWGEGFLAFGAFLVALVTLARLLMVLALCGLANLRRQARPITMAEQLLMWWAGLRGAMAFALAKDLENEMIVSMTITVVLFTTFVQGCSTAMVVRRLGLIRSTPGVAPPPIPNALLRDASYKAALHAAGSGSTGAPPAPPAASSAPPPAQSAASPGEVVMKIRQKRWDNFDRTYMRPIFGGPGLEVATHTRTRMSSAMAGAALGQRTGSPPCASDGSAGGDGAFVRGGTLLSVASQYSLDSHATPGRTACILDTLDDDDDVLEADERDARGLPAVGAATSAAGAPASDLGAPVPTGVWRDASEEGIIDSTGDVHFWRLSASSLRAGSLPTAAAAASALH